MMRVKHTQSGFSLALALVFAGILATTLASLSYVQKGENIRREAEIAGIEGAQLARAARVYSRNEIRDRVNLVADLAAAPEEITVGTLIGESLLPDNFGRENGGQYFNALGQRIRIFLANHPVDGVPTDPSTVPTAYVIFEDNDTSDPSIVQYIVQSIRAENVAVSAPLYDNATNITGACNGGGDTVVLWDTGCMDTVDYTNLTGGAFTPGSFVIPAWRAVNFDTRAMVRFPQPEQVGLQTMYTNLEMGNVEDCVADPSLAVSISTDAGVTATDFCRATDDDTATDTDNRRDIMNVGNSSLTPPHNALTAQAILIDPQTGNDVLYDPTTETFSDATAADTGMNVSGNLNIIRGSGKVFAGDTDIANTVTAQRNITVSGDAGGAELASARIGGELRADNATFESTNVRGDFSANRVGVSVSMTNTSLLDVTDDFVSGQITRLAGSNPPNAVLVGRNANIGGTMEINALNVSGDNNIAGYSAISGNLTANDMAIGGSINAGVNNDPAESLINVEGVTTTPTIHVTSNTGPNPPSTGSARCFGDCPRRRARDQCENAIAFGLTTLSLEDCIENGGP